MEHMLYENLFPRRDYENNLGQRLCANVQHKMYMCAVLPRTFKNH